MFRLVPSPTIFPACSLLRNVVGPMVDTQVVLQKGGRVYVTELEAAEIGRHFGMLGVDAARQKDEQIAALQGELAEARAMVDRIRGDVLAAV